MLDSEPYYYIPAALHVSKKVFRSSACLFVPLRTLSPRQLQILYRNHHKKGTSCTSPGAPVPVPETLFPTILKCILASELVMVSHCSISILISWHILIVSLSLSSRAPLGRTQAVDKTIVDSLTEASLGSDVGVSVRGSRPVCPSCGSRFRCRGFGPWIDSFGA